MAKRFDTVIFDLDSTLVAMEGLSWLSRKKNQDLPLIKASLDGDVPLRIAFQNEMALISPSYQDMLHLGAEYKGSLVENAREMIEILHLLGKEVWLITNNFHPAIDVIANALNIPLSRVYGSHVYFDEYGIYQGFDRKSPLMQNGGKAEIIKHNLHPDMKVAMIGDGIPDLETEPVVDLFIGYGGVVTRPNVKKQAQVFVNTSDLLFLSKYLLDDSELQMLQKHSIHLPFQ